MSAAYTQVHFKLNFIMEANYMNRDQNALKNRVAGQLGLKSSRPLSQVRPGSTQPQSTRPGVFSERSITYVHVYDIRYGFCIIFRTKPKINIKKNIDKHCN